MNRILIVDDDQEIHNLIALSLKNDFEIESAYSLDDTYNILSKRKVDLIVLDENLPDGTGSEFCQKMKMDKDLLGAPVIMLTQVKDITKKLEAFDAGADDYVTKPFEPLELKARINLQLKKAGEKSDSFSREDLHFDVAKNSVYLIKGMNKEEIDMTQKEFIILYNMAKEFKKPFERGFLLSTYWPKSDKVSSRTIDQHMSNIRKKIEESRLTIKSVRKLGYSLDYK